MSIENNDPNPLSTKIDGGQVSNGENLLKEKDGGSVASISEGNVDKGIMREQTARRLALILVYVFAGALALHYAAFLILELTGNSESTEVLKDFLNAWLPALTGIVSASAAYYFSQGS